MEIEVNENVKRKLEVLPCSKCGSDNIEIYNCGYSSFNCAGGKCKRCGHEIETNADYNVPTSTLVKAWNKGNDPDLLIEKLNMEKEKINEEIKRLKKMKSKKDVKTICKMSKD